jgi:hypothetical protein
MAKSLSDRITEARGQGYKDDEIVRFLVQSGIRAQDITTAMQEGYSSTQALDVLTSGRPIEERVARIPGLVARGALPVATGATVGGYIAGVPGMAAGALAVPAAEALTQLYNIAAPQSMQIQTPMQAIGQIAKGMGLPQPETVAEQMITAAGGGIGGAVGTIPGMARMAQTAVTPTGRAIAGQLAARPGQQVVAGAVGPATGEAVADIADSDVAGQIASIVASGAVGAGRGQREIIPTPEAMKQAAGAAYQRSEQAGAIVAPQSLQRAAQDIFKSVDNLGYLPRSQPAVAAFLDEFGAQSQIPLTLERLERLRRVAGNVAASRDRAESKMGVAILNKLDDFVENLKDADLVAGAGPSREVAIDALKEARGLYSRAAKGQEIETLLERAQNTASQYSQSGMENAIRVQFRQLANNQSRLRRFTKDEQELIKGVARGGPVDNVLRYFGKLSPTGVVSGGISSGAGYALGGPVGAAAVPAMGAIAREMAGARMQGNVDELISQILMGRPVQREPATYFNVPAAMRGLLTPQVEVE